MRRSPNPLLDIPAALVFLLAGTLPAAAQVAATANPHGTLPPGLDCSACHTASGWTSLRSPLAFDHAEATDFPLEGRHAEARCAGCHLNLRFDAPRAGATECSSCHLDVHQGSLDGGCTSCHNTTSFQEAAGLDSHARTTFPLTGAHIRVACEQCHAQDQGGIFSPLDAACVGCHRDAYGRGHEDLGGGTFDTECQRCHRTSGWTGVQFDHAALSNGFALQGRHQLAPCESCHTQGGGVRFQAAGADDCIACHRADYDREHTGTGFPTTCSECHGVDDWEHAVFDHLAQTGFPLTDVHAQAPCASCHDPADASLLFPTPAGPQDCVSCHQADYDANHAGTGFTTNCTSCHTAGSWQGASFDHGATTGYPLVGAHATVDCATCHNPADNSLLFPQPAGDQDCVACHQTDYDAKHGGTNFPTTCASCHTESQWQGATFDHSITGYTLQGAHANTSCAKCHDPTTNALLFPQPSSDQDCVACHQADYDANHTGTNFPLTCASCHTTTQWVGATFDHAGVTGFSLLGAHASAPCTGCHNPTTNALLFPQPANDQDCVACHQADYDANHTGTGFPMTCVTCHTTSQWLGATFNHTWFPIYSGKHANRWNTCATCHITPGDYTVFTCMSGGCHGRSKTDNDHSQVNGYVYDAVNCLACHPTGTH